MINEGRQWFKCEGASVNALVALENIVDVELPKKYFELLAFTNGGEGPLPVSPFTLCLDSAESAASFNATSSPSAISDFFIIGGDGAGELIGFDLRGAAPFPVVAIPCIGDGLIDARHIADNFDMLVQIIGLESK